MIRKKGLHGGDSMVETVKMNNDVAETSPFEAGFFYRWIGGTLFKVRVYLINQMVIDDKDRISIFDKNGPYLATKKVGKNNPKADEIKADNEIRMEWNRTVDRAIVSSIPEAEILELKKTEITDRVKESVEKNGSKPELFGNIVRAAVLLLEKQSRLK